MMPRCFLWVSFLLFVFQPAGWTQSAQDRALAAAFKTLAKGYVATANIENIKKNKIEQIRTMTPVRFKREYAGVYKILGQMPQAVRDRYGIVPAMSQKKTMRVIESFRKDDVYEVIDAIPDAAVVEYLEDALNQKKTQIKSSNAMEQVGMVWNTIVKRLNQKG